MLTEFILWCSVTLVFYAYLGYPLALAVLALFRSHPVRKETITPTVSFIIAAHNEEARIRGKIDNTLAQNYPPELLDIIVVSDCSTDRTDLIVSEYAPRVRLIRALERRGKEAAQQLALASASGEVVIFSDASTALAPDAVSAVVANFADCTVGCVSSVDRFVDSEGRVSGEGAYVRYEMLLRSLETRVNTLVGLSGSFFAARREVCQRWAVDRQSDFNTLLNAVDMGLRGVLDVRSEAYYRNIVDERRELRRKTRTVARGIRVLLANAQMLNPVRYGVFAWQLASHKLCRWLVPFAMIASFVCNALLVFRSPFYLLTFFVQSAFYVAALWGGWRGTPLLRFAAFLCLANLGVLIAWIRVACGHRFVVWSPSDRVGTLPEPGIR
jgi:cellulose synthase/poly-beta-1,6-N-acetylglucosamine synthase-like glycosyltransferase